MRKSRSSGYTLIEVLLVLTISSLIFIGATSIFGSRRQAVEFSQSIYDIQSKIKQYSTNVSTGNFLETSSYTCEQNALTQRPALKLQASTASNSSQDCVYLGKALLPVIGSSDIYVYDVLGLRNIHNGLVDTGEYVQSIADAKPEPAGSIDGAGNFTYLFSEKYTLQNGVIIASATTGASNGGILKIYSTLENNNTSSRGLTAYSSNYNYQAGDEQTALETSTRLRDCIRESTACTTTYNIESAGWNLCLQGSGVNGKAILTVRPSANGLVTKLNVTDCS